MKLFTKLFVCSILGVFVAIGCNSGGGGIEQPDTPGPNQPGTVENRILNGVRDNAVPVGISSFPMGIREKFPLRDDQQIDGIGYKVVARAVKRIATNELYTFPERQDPEQVFETLKFFIDNGHQVLHEIHILNGPGMRRAGDVFVNEMAGADLYPDQFIHLLYNSHEFRTKVLSLFADVVVHAKRLEALGVEVYICPELEDNHESGDSGSYGILLDFLRAAGWTNPDGSLRRDRVVRNGGRVGKIQGIRYEKHPHSKDEFIYALNSLRPGDFINTDGESFHFDNEDKDVRISESDIRYMIDASADKNIIFYFWSAELQGYKYIGDGKYVVYPEYLNRYYILQQPLDTIGMLLGIPGSEVRISGE